MKLQTSIATRVGLVLTFIMCTGSAHAQLMVYDPGAYMQIQMAAQTISQTISQSTSEQTESLNNNLDKNVEDLKKAVVNAISGAAETTSKASSGAARTVGESAQRTASEQATIRNEERFSGIDPCNVLVSTIGTSTASRNTVTASGGGGGGGAPRGAPGGSAGMEEVLNVAERRVVAGAPEVEAVKAAKAACSSFGGSGVRGRACTDAGFSAQNTTGFPNADLRASTLFDGPQTSDDGSSVKRKLTVDLAGPEGTAMRALIRNLDQPVQLKDLSKAQRNSDAGRQYLALEDAFQARMSVAKYPQDAQAGLLAAKAELIPMVQQMLRSEDAAFVQRYLNENVPNWSSKGISMAELLALETQRRYMNSDWHLRVLKMTDTDLARENLRMMAMNAWMYTLGLDRQIVSSVIESNAAQAAVRAELMPQLIAANTRAVSR